MKLSAVTNWIQDRGDVLVGSAHRTQRQIFVGGFLRSLTYSAFVLLFTPSLVAHAGTIQLTSSSQLLSSDTTLIFPTPRAIVSPPLLTGPQVFSANGNIVTFTDTGNIFSENVVGQSYTLSEFPLGTVVLTASGYFGSNAPIFATFTNPVSEFGFNAEEGELGPEVFTLTVFDGQATVGTFTASGYRLSSLPFLGARASGGTVITSFELSDAESNDIVLGPVTFGLPPSSLTPEPSSFALLCTGMLGVAGLVRKRFV